MPSSKQTLTPELAKLVARTLTEGAGVTGITAQAWEDIGTLAGGHECITMHRYVVVVSAASAPLPEPAWSEVDADTRGVFEAMKYVAHAYDAERRKDRPAMDARRQGEP
jgi:hypothetical protein